MIMNMIHHHDQMIKNIASDLKSLTQGLSSLLNQVKAIKTGQIRLANEADDIKKRMESIESSNTKVSFFISMQIE